MFKLIATFFDRIIFTLMFIIGVQAPEFIQQYIQRLSGHLNEAKFQLQQFQTIADIQFKGDLTELINRYKTNSDTAIKQTGEVVQTMVERINGFEWQLNQLQEGGYLMKVYHFFTQIDLSMAQATAQHYQLAIPLEIGALATGFVFALFIVMIEMLSIFSMKSVSKVVKRKLHNKKQLNNTNATN